ncbi:hypothetical protein ACIGBL_33310 [Streptomyces sp. NPDC085614]|uniref:hypothetical protein n=1 Tax=Streptomyces sp. NPDC085614 TaxID=3365733 RepID=UPI0037CFC675
MDDTKTFKIQLKGKAYDWRPITSEQLERLQLVIAMQASNERMLRVVARILAESAGPEQWETLSDRIVDGEISMSELLDHLQKVAARQAKDAKARGK